MTTPLETFDAYLPGGVVHVILAPEDRTVRAAGYGDLAALAARLAPELQARGLVAVGAHGPVADALAAYADGDGGALTTISVLQPGGPFRTDVWETLRRIPAGTTVTYTELAALAGRPAAVRAAASACATNLVAPIVPCHRVVRRDATLGGYLYGLPVKETLLAHERAASR